MRDDDVARLGEVRAIGVGVQDEDIAVGMSVLVLDGVEHVRDAAFDHDWLPVVMTLGIAAPLATRMASCAAARAAAAFAAAWAASCASSASRCASSIGAVRAAAWAMAWRSRAARTGSNSTGTTSRPRRSA